MRSLNVYELPVVLSLLIGFRGFRGPFTHRESLTPEREKALFGSVTERPAPPVLDGRRAMRDEIQEGWSIYEHPERKPIRRGQMEEADHA